MARYYVDDDRDSGAGCLVALFLAILLIFVMLYIAAVVLYYTLIGIVIVAGIIGIVITLKNYILELRNSIVYYKNASAPVNWKLPVFFYRWYKIILEPLKGCWVNNVNSIRASFQKAAAFRFLSIKRWFNWLLGVSIAVFGVLATLFILQIQFWLIVFALYVLFYLVMALLVVTVCLGIGMCLFVAFSFYISSSKTRAAANGAQSFAQYVRQYGYKDIFAMIRLLWQNANAEAVQSAAQFRQCKLLSLKKWLALGSMLCIHLVTVAVMPIIFIMHMTVQTVLFIVFSFSK